MFFKLLRLEIKSLFRSPQLAVSILSKIGIFFISIYFAIIFFGGAFALYYASIEEGEDPLKLFARFFIAFWVVDLVIKYFLQQMPTENIKPFLTQNLSKNKIVSLTIFKILFSFLTWGYLLFMLPFGILLATDADYTLFGVFAISITTLALVFGNVLVNILINKNNKILFLIFGLLAIGGTIQYYQLFDFLEFSEKILMTVYQQGFWAIIPVLLLIIFGRYIFNFIKKSLYLDQGLELKKAKVQSENIAFLNRYGIIGVFINNDIRLIKRSKMARSAALGGIFFLMYGLSYFMDGYKSSFMQVFLGIFTTGGFMFTFGQRVPAWDSSYYPLMMTQNIPYQEYLKAKWSLSAISIVLTTILSLGYAYISWNFYFTILAAGLYNLGFNSYITLLSGAYNKKPIDLNSTTKAFTGGENNFNPKLLLLLIPQIALPMGVFGLVNLFFGLTPAVFSLGFLGLIGFLFRNKIFAQVVKVYKSEKYATLLAFKQN